MWRVSWYTNACGGWSPETFTYYGTVLGQGDSLRVLKRKAWLYSNMREKENNIPDVHWILVVKSFYSPKESKQMTLRYDGFAVAAATKDYYYLHTIIFFSIRAKAFVWARLVSSYRFLPRITGIKEKLRMEDHQGLSMKWRNNVRKWLVHNMSIVNVRTWLCGQVESL